MPEHPCDECGSTFPFPSRLRDHQMAMHLGERPFVCGVCQKTFILAGNLKSHQAVHSEELPFACTQCPKKFRHVGSMYRHQTVHSKVEHVCPYCAMAFLQKESLTKHVRRHGPLGELVCITCKRAFGFDVAGLTLHVRIHRYKGVRLSLEN